MRIRSLYTRMVLIFILVVVISLFVSAIVTRLLYGQDVLERLQRDSLVVGKQIVRYLVDNEVEDVEGYLASSAVTNTYEYAVFRKGSVIQTNELLTAPIIAQVLEGGVYRSEISISLQDPNKVQIGLPFQIQGQAYALFVKPNLKNMFSEFNKILPTFFFIIFAVGCLMILIVTTYFIRPIRKMTLATRKIAQGDYHVQVILNRYDELGELARSFNHMVMELQQIEKMRQDFISNVSHEIQSPMTSIRGFSLTLQNQELTPEERQRFLRIIVTESERLSKLTENLLKLASLESSLHPLHIERYRVDEQIRQMVITMEPQWTAKQLSVELDTQNTWIEADQDLMMQVWTNLMSNSIKFTPEGGRITIQHRIEPDYHEIQFSDTGIGIAEEERSHVFRRFYKVDASRNRAEGGNGLGLSIVHRILSLHCSTIHVIAHPPQGTTFVIRMPKEH